MKTQKLILILAVMMISITTYAQCGYRGQNGPHHFNRNWSQIPDLTADQQESIQQLRETFWAEMKVIREDETLSPAEKREAFLNKRTEHHNAVRALLSKEQQKAFDAGLPPAGRYGGYGPCGKGFGYHAWQNGQVPDYILEQRLAFENELNESEKATIEEVRQVVAQHRQQVQLNGDDMTAVQWHEMHREHMDDLEPLFEIADQHETELQDIQQAIRENNIENCPYNGKGRGYGRGPGRFGMGPGRTPGIHFLLLDPSEINTSAKEMEGISDDIEIYPNPVEGPFEIRFDVPEEGLVSIELLNKQGELLEVLDSSVRSTGSQTLQVNANGLPDHEIYFVRVHLPGKVLVEKFIKD